MSISIDKLRELPVFRRITTDHMNSFVDAFERKMYAPGDLVFEAGSEATHFHLLVEGGIVLTEGDDERYELHAPAPIGELGALVGIPRNTTARAATHAEVWQISREEMMDFFEEHGDVAFPFYHNLMQVVGDKIRVDTRRMDEMRTNIIRTQKAMKKMRDLILESPDTEFSEPIHDTLQSLIGQNRKSNYVVGPPKTMPARVRFDNGQTHDVMEISAVWLSIDIPNSAYQKHEHVSCVLEANGKEIPLSGTVSTMEGSRVVIELDLLLEEYAAVLEDYLTRVQMLQVVV